MIDWAKSFIFTFGILVIISFIYPEGTYQKNIKFVLSLVLIMSIVVPLINMFRDFDINSLSQNEMIQSENFDTKQHILNSRQIYEDAIISNYTREITRDIRKKLSELGVTLLDIMYELETTDKDNFGKIYSVNITVDNAQKENEIKNIINKFYEIDKEHIIILGRT